jgi:formylglycine-generating enzyme required for sulfatase activity
MRTRSLTNRILIWPAVLLAALLVAACDQDDDPVQPDPPTTGTILVRVIPDTLAAPWTLVDGAGGQTEGAGCDTLPDASPDDYRMFWGEMEGWTRIEPAASDPVPVALAPGDTIAFTAGYEPDVPIWDRWVTIPAGSFFMGATDSEETALRNEKPRHQVTLTRPFLMQATEVTNQQYLQLARWALAEGLATATADGLHDNLDGSSELLMDFSDLLGGEPWCEIEYRNGQLQLRDIGHGLNPDHPVKMVTWYGAVAYCDWLSLAAGLPRAYDHADWSCGGGHPYSAQGYRLPTEAEWEYACRAGATTPFYSGEITDPWGSNEPALEAVAWYQGNSVDWTQPVAQLQPNGWGLYDMHGNLFKWVNGFEYAYAADPVSDPVSPMAGGNRVAKGGAWTRPSHYHRVAFRRLRETLDYRGPKQGFRPVRTVAAGY